MKKEPYVALLDYLFKPKSIARLVGCVVIDFLVISNPSPIIPSGASNLVVWLRAGSVRNL
jgi:hypothetical protein